MQVINYPLRFSMRAGLVSILLLLGGCLSFTGSERAGPSVQELDRLAASLEHEDAAQRFESLAKNYSGNARTRLLLRAATAWLDANRPDRARILLDELQTVSAGENTLRQIYLLSAKQRLASGDPRDSLAMAQRSLEVGADNEDVAILRANALFKMGAVSAAMDTLLPMLDDPLRDDSELKMLHDMAWQGLTQARSPLNEIMQHDDAPPSLEGWLVLGYLGQTLWEAPFSFPQRLQDFQSQHPEHSANTYLIPALVEDFQRRLEYPAKVALMLPMNGRFANSAAAVRDGFLAAHFQAQANGNNVEVEIVDSGENRDDALYAYEAAHRSGAGIVVGPLTKSALSAIADQGVLPLEVIGLNYLDQHEPGHPQIYQFGLRPEDEAAEVAERVIQEGLRRGVALFPDSDWGRRMLSAFNDRFTELGGELLSAQGFDDANPDFSTPIMRMLNLDESRLRYQALRARLGVDLKTEPRRRQDVQFIYLVARDREAPLIRPQLRFHQAINLPVYATSYVYNPARDADRDLDGIAFTDMPWILASEGIAGQIREDIRRSWPDNFDRNSRLYALGFDAYRLIPLLLNFDQPLSAPVPGMTGLLSMDGNNRIRRNLYWARFRGGYPYILAAPGEAVQTFK